MAGLIISERQVGEVTILNLSGDITFGDGNIALRNAIRRAISVGKKKILLNLERVFYVDSSGIGELVSGFIAVTRVDGQLKLSNLSQRIRELLAITNLLIVFDVLETEDAALDNFN
jgi:anti-sigma B factor antagonist